MNISAELRAEAARQNLKYSDLAKALGTTRQAVSKKLRNDSSNYYTDELTAYSNVLRIPISTIYARAEQAEASAIPTPRKRDTREPASL